jgi:gamma-glutamyltranspeptidase / glutathione hydrolase / leukotriene-C4 hydrolase
VQLLTNMTSKDYALYIRSQIQDGVTFNDPAHYGANTVTANNHGTAHISVIASDGSAVAATSTINL